MKPTTKVVSGLILLGARIPLAISILAFPAGPPAGVTGGFGEPTCNQKGCHNSFELNAGRAAGLGDLIITGLPQKYEAGKTYPIKVTHTHTQGRDTWGFQLAARLQGTGAQAGQLQPVDANTQVLVEHGIQYIEHTTRGTNENIFNFKWVAPESAPGTVIMHAAGNAANGDLTPEGDYIYTTSALSTAGGGGAVTLDFPQVAVGGGYRAFLVLNNPGSVTAGQGTVTFTRPDGQPMALQINGATTSSHSFSIPARGYLKLTLADPGTQVRTGWCQVTADSTLGGVLTYQFMDGEVLISQASVPPSGRLRNSALVVPQLGGSTLSGLALANPDNQTAQVALQFWAPDGRAAAETSISLGAGQQVARFVSQFFSTLSADQEGTVEVTTSVNVVPVGLTFQGTAFATLPVSAVSAAGGGAVTLNFPQVAVGGGYRAFLALNNPSTTSAIEGTAIFKGQDGRDLALQINGKSASAQSFSIPARGYVKLTLEDPGTHIKVGWCQVTAGSRLGGVLTYQLMGSQGVISQASVPPAEGTRNFVMAVPQLGGSTETGLAIANPEGQTMQVTLRFWVPEGGNPAAEAAIILEPGQQVARFVSQFFSNLPAGREGTLEVMTSSNAVAVGLVFQGSAFATLPLLPLDSANR